MSWAVLVVQDVIAFHAALERMMDCAQILTRWCTNAPEEAHQNHQDKESHHTTPLSFALRILGEGGLYTIFGALGA